MFRLTELTLNFSTVKRSNASIWPNSPVRIYDLAATTWSLLSYLLFNEEYFILLSKLQSNLRLEAGR